MAKTDPIRIIPHEIIPDMGSFEVRFSDGRKSEYFYWDNDAGRRAVSMSRNLTKEQAMAKTVDLARVERGKMK